MKRQRYITPAITVIRLSEQCGLCNFTTEKKEAFGFQNTPSGQPGHSTNSFENDYGDLFSSSQAKALGAEPVGESAYEELEEGN